MADDELDFADDTLIYPILDELRACLCQALGEMAPCFCGILVGDDIPMEYTGIGGDCEQCGAAYVRVISGFPSMAFPTADEGGAIDAPIAFTVAVGIIRCAPEDGRQGIDADELRAFGRRRLADMSLALRAIRCCFDDDKFEVDVALGTYTPLPMEGGAGGGEWTLTVSQEL